MKAERRHELQTNALSRLMAAAPDFFSKHGNKLLLGLVVIVGLVVAWQWRQRANAAEQAKLRGELEIARRDVQQLQGGGLVPGDAKGQIEDVIRAALPRLKDPADQAQAYLILGDYYLALAQYPVSAEAATRPSAHPDRPAGELLGEAEKAYETVLKLFNDPIGVLHARSGLAAVAQDRAFFVREQKDKAKEFYEEARKQYKAILDNQDIADFYKIDAGQCLKQVDLLIDNPVEIGPPATKPVTPPKPPTSTSQPGTKPSTKPLPTVRPSSDPVQP